MGLGGHEASQKRIIDATRIVGGRLTFFKVAERGCCQAIARHLLASVVKVGKIERAK